MLAQFYTRIENTFNNKNMTQEHRICIDRDKYTNFELALVVKFQFVSSVVK